MKSGASAANLFYEYKLLLPWMLYDAYLLIDATLDSGFYSIIYILSLMLIYYGSWIYYYHLNICQRRVAPLLDQYKTQLI